MILTLFANFSACSNAKTKVQALAIAFIHDIITKDVVMTYGPQSTEYMASDWQSHASRHGRKTLIDRNFSVAPSVMESTYVDAKTGEYLTGRLGPESKEIITGYKRAHTGFAFMPEGTPVLSTEAAKTGNAAVPSKPFDIVALDKEGCYLTKTKQVLKKYVPTDAHWETVYAKLKAFSIDPAFFIQDVLQSYCLRLLQQLLLQLLQRF